MTTKVIYLPLDERPCNWLYPQQLAAMTDLQMIVPSLEKLGNKKQRAELQGISSWLQEQSSNADVVIISLDMLVHGGIVPSRLHHDSLEACRERLMVLHKLKQDNPSLRIYAFNLITRVPAYSSSEEEPDYYDQVGREIYELGWLSDKSESVGLNDGEQTRLNEVLAAIPRDVLQDYRTRRGVNAKINELALELTEKGIIDYLIIPLDDNSQYGFSAMEQRALTIRTELAGLSHRVAIYPGADEIGCTLFARVFCEVKNYTPSLFVRYSSTKGPLCIPKYEDRSLNESIKAHLTSAGAILADASAEADCILMVHSPAIGQSEMAETGTPIEDRHRSYFSEINTREFVQAMKYYLDAGRLVMLADVALCNGGDHLLMNLLHHSNMLGRIGGYAAWNTSGNSLGTVISHGVIQSYYQNSEPETDSSHQQSKMFYVSRLIEDWGYQALVRQEVCDNHLPELGASYFELSHVVDEVCVIIEQKLNDFVKMYLQDDMVKNVIVRNVSLPWTRMFEVGFTLEIGGA